MYSLPVPPKVSTRGAIFVWVDQVWVSCLPSSHYFPWLRERFIEKPPSVVQTCVVFDTFLKMIFILDPPVAVGIVGVGLALAREFLRFGDNVVICSRSGKYLAVFHMRTLLGFQESKPYHICASDTKL
jgi:hypothetical protein